ncbi:hypothetical protein A1O3_02344 [Capronia epimyces CBS 606.96]|uniref:Uncharacterized protein n=1 Tax=Capronia epimyces CBS 606.96 TaxID=1182542 RepID=W9Y9S2_9EURO|nr:uncharacterized protein A1O3_02344 [Capronia epimyces CBS 606.96]EXJ89278.1 hypothetical protein A1O3_02344 [Capronia epimyces CBS 606.96]
MIVRTRRKPEACIVRTTERRRRGGAREMLVTSAVEGRRISNQEIRQTELSYTAYRTSMKEPMHLSMATKVTKEFQREQILQLEHLRSHPQTSPLLHKPFHVLLRPRTATKERPRDSDALSSPEQLFETFSQSMEHGQV